jgi:hypothetical protein
MEEEYQTAIALHEKDPDAYPAPTEPDRVHAVTIGSDPVFRDWYHDLSEEERDEFRVHIDTTRDEAGANKAGNTAKQVAAYMSRTTKLLEDIVSSFHPFWNSQ